MNAREIVSDTDFERLAEKLADAIAKRIAPRQEYWSAKDIAHALGHNPKTVYDIVNKAGFPEPRYFTKERRWKSAEVIAWADKQGIALTH